MAFETFKLTDNLFIILGRRHGHFPMSHSFLVRDEITTLIDTGCGLDLLAEIKETFQIDMIINSHGHPDHSAGNWVFPEAALHVPKMGAESHGRLELLSRRFFTDRPQAKRWRGWIRETMGFQDREPTHFFDDGYVFNFGRTTLQAIHTPGHTKDHFCFLELENGILLTFDIDLTTFGPWYGNLESNLKDFRSAIQRVRDLRPRVIASSHSAPLFDSIGERLDEYESVMDHRTQVIREIIKDGASRADIIKTKPIYGYHPYAREILPLFEARMIDLHLEEMIELGMAQADGELFRTI
ncbi:MAG: MBL fold metallo-hydrolase [Desulfomonilaceae bacterium]